jgi:hypothetical protein
VEFSFALADLRNLTKYSSLSIHNPCALSFGRKIGIEEQFFSVKSNQEI